MKIAFAAKEINLAIYADDGTEIMTYRTAEYDVKLDVNALIKDVGVIAQLIGAIDTAVKKQARTAYAERQAEEAAEEAAFNAAIRARTPDFTAKI